MSQPEVEFSVVGPKEAFVENLSDNINLVRRRLPIKELVVDEMNVGSMTHTRVAMIYLDGLADVANVEIVKKRLQAIDFDQIMDSSFIEQIIADNNYSPFPSSLIPNVLTVWRQCFLKGKSASWSIVPASIDRPHNLG